MLSASIEHGLGNRPVRFIMLAAPFTSGVSIYVFYALQPFLLDLYGDPKAYSIAGLAAAIVAGAQIAGGFAAVRLRAAFRRRTSAVLLATIATAVVLALLGVVAELLAGAGPARGVRPAVRGRDADPVGVHQRHDPVAAAGHGAVVRLADGQHRRRRDPARAGQGCRRVELRHVVRGGERLPARGGPVRAAEPARERPCRRRRRRRPPDAIASALERDRRPPSEPCIRQGRDAVSGARWRRGRR